MTEPRKIPKAALVTGAARRIGRKIALALANDGFDLALHTSQRSLVETQTLAANLNSHGQRAIVLVADLGDAAATAALMPKAMQALGPLTLLVNNASMFENDAVSGFDFSVFDRHMAANLRAPLILASALAAGLPADVPGNVINIIDQRVWRLNPNFFSYTLSKAALWTATQTMAQALAPQIRVNGIGPGPTLANVRQAQSEFAKQASAIPLGRAIDPDEIVAALFYLLRAPSVTGQMIAVDGGQHLAWETPDVVGIVE